MKAILIRNGKSISGKLAEIFVSKGLAEWENEINEQSVNESQSVSNQEAILVKKQGRPKGSAVKKQNTKKTITKK